MYKDEQTDIDNQKIKLIIVRQMTIANAQAIAELHVGAWLWTYKGLRPGAYFVGLPLTIDRRGEFLRNEIAHMPSHTRG